MVKQGILTNLSLVRVFKIMQLFPDRNLSDHPLNGSEMHHNLWDFPAASVEEGVTWHQGTKVY